MLTERFGGQQLPAEDILDERGFMKVPRKHCTIPQLLAAGLIAEDYRSTMLTVATVRNPFDSLASMYVKKREKYQPLLADKTAWIYRVPGYVEDMEFCRTHSFEEWLERHHEVSALDRLLGRGRKSLCDRYTVGVHRVMRFERLQQDFTAIMRGLGITQDVTIPIHNVTKARKARYHSYYTDHARRLVEYVFMNDLQRYGYSFDGATEVALLPAVER